MMMSSSSSSSSSSSATVAVEKATSDLLISPDWTMNIDICDSINSHQWQAKDVVKAVKKRLQHKNSKVQLLALTLLETMVKNCGDFVHFQIAEKNVLGEMVKIVKKKAVLLKTRSEATVLTLHGCEADMQVRDKILVLLDSWQEAFGGPGGKHPQYYWAFEDLRRYGVQFPKRSPDAAPIFTPPVTHPTLGQAEASYGMPSNSSRRLDETMASEVESLSLSSLDSMRDVMELLNDMLQAVNPSDREAVKDEVIVDLVNRCQSNQKKLMQMLTTTGDDELLGRGLELNDSLQNLLAKHDAIASGSPIPAEVANLSPKPTKASSSIKSPEVCVSSPTPNGNHPATVASATRALIDEEEEEEDDFALLARRHSKPKPVPSQNTLADTGGALVPVNNSNTTSLPADTIATTSNALALPDPPAPVRTSKEQDMIDLLSITLSTTSTSSQTPDTPPASNQSTQQVPAPPSTQGNPYASQTYPRNQGQVPYNSYVAPWAQPQSQPVSQPQLHSQSQPQFQPQVQHQYSSVYPPPPWAATPGYFNNQNHLSGTNNMFSTPRANMPASNTPLQGARPLPLPLQPNRSFPSRGNNCSVTHGDPPSTTAQKPFIPSYRLFEDLNVLGSVDAKLKMTNNSSPSLSGTSGQGMVGGRK